ncbi:Helix-loop-helix DNA-binding domain protein, partial [Trichostrongylus colubriformis]
SAGHAKWEKADILEMTVDYLKKLRALRGHTSTFNVAVALDEKPSHGVKECESTPTSAVPSPSSAESTSDGPTVTKRRRIATASTPPTTEETRPFAPPPAPPTPNSIVTLPPTRIPPITSSLRPPPPNFNFMAQHLLALQYQQNFKMATIAPGMVPTITPVHPFAMTAIPWRTM